MMGDSLTPMSSGWAPFSFAQPPAGEPQCKDPSHAVIREMRIHILDIEQRLIRAEADVHRANQSLLSANQSVATLTSVNTTLQTSINTLNTAFLNWSKAQHRSLHPEKNNGMVVIDKEEKERRIRLANADRTSPKFLTEWKDYQEHIDIPILEFQLANKLKFEIPRTFAIPSRTVAEHLANQVGILMSTPTGSNTHSCPLGVKSPPYCTVIRTFLPSEISLAIDDIAPILHRLNLDIKLNSSSSILVIPECTLELPGGVQSADAGEQASMQGVWSAQSTFDIGGTLDLICGWIKIENTGIFPYALFPKEKMAVLYGLFGKYESADFLQDAIAMAGGQDWQFQSQAAEVDLSLPQSVICTASIIHHLVKAPKPTSHLKLHTLTTVEFDDLEQSSVAVAQSYAQEFLKESMVHSQLIDCIIASGRVLHHSA